jgi:undecaprenyl-diphosphatase
MTKRLRPVERFTGRSAVGLLAMAAAATGFGALLVLVRLNWAPLETADRGIADALNRAVAGSPLLIKVLETVTTLGGPAAIWWLVTVGAACMVIRRQVQLAAYLVVAGAGALVLTPLIKMFVGRMRPVVPDPILAAPGNSFPSGHTLNATVFCGALLLVLLPAIPRRWRRAAVGLAVTMAVLVGFSRAALGVHYASDVVAGWLLGVAWIGVTAYAFRLWRVEIGEPERPLAEGLEPEAAGELTPTRFAPVPHILRGLGWLAGAWIVIVAVLAGLGTLVTAWSPAFDEAPSHWIAARRTAELTVWSRFFSDAGNTHAITLALLIVVPLAVAWTRRWRPAVFFVVLLVGEVTIFVASAALVGRDRPYVTLLDGHLPTSSFPSGHVAATACFYGGLAVFLVPRTRAWVRAAVIALAVIMPLMIAVARIYRGAHHPLDVTGGIVLAVLWLTAVTLAVRPNADLLAPLPSAPDPVPVGPAATAAGPPPVDGHRAGTRSTVVVNPTKVTRMPGRRAEIGQVLTGAGWAVPGWLETSFEDPGTGQARQAVSDGASVVFAAGGDGTVMACAGALLGTDVALAVLPFGTGNLLARNLGVPMRITEAVALATAAGRRQLDVGLVEDRCFLIMAGMGLDAAMLHDAPAMLKARIGWPAYGLAALRHLCALPMTVEISLDGAPPLTRQARTVLVGNCGGLQGGIRLMPDAVPDDGVLDVAVLMPPRRRNWLALAWALLRRQRTPPSIEVFRAAHIAIRSDQQHPRQLDGELIQPSHAMTVGIRPGALRVCVPPQAAGTRQRSAVATTADPAPRTAG